MIKLEQNIKNKTWWIAIISALIVLFKLWGIDLTDYIGKDWQNTVNSICTIAILLGISIDTTTQNIGGVTNETIQETSADENISTVTQLNTEQVPQAGCGASDTMNIVQTPYQEPTPPVLNSTKLAQIQQILNQ